MIDFTKPVQTRDGREVRIYSADPANGGDYPAHGAIKDADRGFFPQTWAMNGSVYNGGNEKPSDLINVPETYYVPVYTDKTGRIFSSSSTLLSEEAAKEVIATHNYYLGYLPFTLEDLKK